ncbi:hypothetical protein ACWDO7_17905 [Streptomyces sp. NPDC003656]
MRAGAVAVAEFLGWWVVLAALWLLFIGPVDGAELAVGSTAAALGALAACAARRAVGTR